VYTSVSGAAREMHMAGWQGEMEGVALDGFIKGGRGHHLSHAAAVAKANRFSVPLHASLGERPRVRVGGLGANP